MAAAYIGFSLGGSGKANAVGAFVGAVLIGVLQNGLVMLSVPYFAMDIVKGAVLTLALALLCVAALALRSHGVHDSKATT